jgi:uncharacterized protein (TIGR02147 family)
MPNVFAYNDFRRYLKDYIAERKQTSRAFSQRFLLRKLGVTSSGFLANILSGTRNLPAQYVSRMAQALGLGSKHARYFETLVAFNQAKRLAEKERLYQELVSLKPAEIKTLEGRELRLFSEWYYVAIRELICFFSVRDNYEELARKLLPLIQPREAKKAVEDLLDIGLLERLPNGRLRQGQKALSTGDTVRSVQAAAYQRGTMRLALEALDRVPYDDRDISTLTLTFSDRSFRKAVEEVRQLRKSLLKLAIDEQAPDRVFQCNLQIFPLSKK